MKNFKTIIGLLMAMVMTLSMSFNTVFAEDEATNTISFTNTTGNHTYLIYQIFTGDITDGELQNIQWGSDVLESFTSTQDSAGVYAAALAEMSGEEAAAELVKSVINKDSNTIITVTGTAIKDTEDTEKVVGYSYDAQTVAPGYYLIIDSDTDDPLNGTNDAYSAYVLKLVSDITVTPKTNVPSVEKKVKDINDSTGVETDWQDSADYDIGDTVPFKLTATLGSDNIDKYETYYLQFVDTLSKGLTFDSNSVVVKIGETTIDATNSENQANYNVDTSTNDDGSTKITVTFDDVKTLGATNNSVITVEYSATLNENAVIGTDGNPNTVKLIFSNNPDNSGEGTGETPEDKVIVFTYKLDVDKIDGTTNEALKGAAFELYKITGVTAETIKSVTVTYENNTASISGVEGAAIEKVDIDSTTTDQTNFAFTGIDDGYYVLIETTTPSGYNTVDPVIFEVSATHDTDSEDPKLTSLSGTDVAGTITLTASADNSTLSTDIANYSGSTLPETGGMGTRVLYTLGGIFVIAALVLLVTKKRMRNN